MDRLDPNLVPWSCEAEQAVLGAAMLDPRAVELLIDLGLQAQHFFDRRHAAIWSAVQALGVADHPADVITVHARLADQGQAENVGSPAYLGELVASIPSAASARRYAEIVLGKALLRAVVAAADQAREVARQPGNEAPEAVLDRVTSIFASLQRGKTPREPLALSELLAGRIDHWQDLAEGRKASGIPVGLPRLDNALGGGIKPGKVIVLAARPSVGKTSLATQIGLAVATQGNGVLMLSQEMTAGELVDRMVAHLGAVPLGSLTGGEFADDDWSRISGVAESALKLPFFVDDQPALSLLDIRGKVRSLQRRQPLALVIVDYLQLCASSQRGERRHHQIEEISRGIKALAKEAGVSMLLLSQLKRIEGEPELDDLKESGAIEEDADTAILLHPIGVEPDGSQTILAKVAKNRQGRRGRLALAFHGRTQRWRESNAATASRGASTA